MARKERFADRYMNEVFSYGGIPTRRIDILRDLQAKGFDARSIEYYMMGLEQSRDRKERREAQKSE